MSSHHRLWLLLAPLAGLAIAAWIVGRTGLAQVIEAIVAIGPVGFGAFCLYSILSSLPLGGAWVASAPPLSLRRHLLSFTWARLVREAAAEILPFSQVGGIVLGARVLIARGVNSARVNASMIVDMTTELAGQLVFTLFAVAGLLYLTNGRGEDDLLVPILLGTGTLLVMVVAFFVAQRRLLDLGINLFGRLIPSVGAHIGEMRVELAAIYACKPRVLAALAFNLAAWLLSAAGAWIGLLLMDVHLPLFNVLVIEGLVFAMRSVAFMIPGALGVQEAAYMVLGPLLGLSPTSAVALSLLKRARDLAIGIPILAGWQLGEARTMQRKRNTRAKDCKPQSLTDGPPITERGN